MQSVDFEPWPSFTEEEIDAVSAVLRSNRVNYWTGNIVKSFEAEFAEFAGTRHAIALANGTLALDLILHGLGIGARNGGSSDDEVIVTSRSFIASVSTVVNAGALPVFVDLDRDSQNISAAEVAKSLSPNTRAVIAVHLAGWPCDIDAIRNVVSDSSVHIIEDCAQAHGAVYKGRPVGSLGVAAAWSFCQDKIMTTGGEGGMVTCDDPDLWDRMWSYKDHGKSHAAVHRTDHAPGFRWVHESFGTNFRMTEMQGAIGRIQLQRMPEWKAKRSRNASLIIEALEPFTGEGGSIRLASLNSRNFQNDRSEHANYKFYAFIRPENLKSDWSRDRIVEAVTARGVPCFQGSCSEIYLEKAFDDSSLRPAHALPVAKELGETSLMLLVHPTLSANSMGATIDALKTVLSLATA